MANIDKLIIMEKNKFRLYIMEIANKHCKVKLKSVFEPPEKFGILSDKIFIVNCLKQDILFCKRLNSYHITELK